jgi:alpha-tubulin suppressor-like RCC1 family protein
LDDQGRVWTMGENKFGQLGRTICNSITSTGKASAHSVPELVDGPFGKDQSLPVGTDQTRYRCVELNSGWSHLVARVDIESSILSETSCAVFGWGRSDKGQLGCGEKCLSTPRRIDGFLSDKGATVVSTACGSDSTHFLVQANGGVHSIYSVGWNEHGNLGIGPQLSSKGEDAEDVLEPVKVPGMSRVVSPATDPNRLLLAAGGAHMLVIRL